MASRTNQQSTALMEPWKTPIVEVPVDDGRRMVSYHSDPMARALGFLIKYAGLCASSAILSAGVVLYMEADAVTWLVIFGAMSFIGWIAVGLIENLFSAEGIDRLRIRTGAAVQATYVTAERDVELGRIDNQNRAEDIKRLSSHVEQLYLQIESMRRDALHAPQSNRNRLSNYLDPLEHDGTEQGGAGQGRPPIAPPEVPPPVVTVGRTPVVDEMKHQVQRWFIQAFNGEALAEDGRIVRGTPPWTERGALTQTDKDRARDWIKLAGNAAGAWIVRYDKARRGWYVNVDQYATSGAVLNALDQAVPRK